MMEEAGVLRIQIRMTQSVVVLLEQLLLLLLLGGPVIEVLDVVATECGGVNLNNHSILTKNRIKLCFFSNLAKKIGYRERKVENFRPKFHTPFCDSDSQLNFNAAQIHIFIYRDRQTNAYAYHSQRALA